MRKTVTESQAIAASAAAETAEATSAAAETAEAAEAAAKTAKTSGTSTATSSRMDTLIAAPECGPPNSNAADVGVASRESQGCREVGFGGVASARHDDTIAHSSAMLAYIVSADAGADGNSGDCPVHKVLCLDPQEAAAAVAGEVVDLN
jgi:hypothetical protein